MLHQETEFNTYCNGKFVWCESHFYIFFKRFKEKQYLQFIILSICI